MIKIYVYRVDSGLLRYEDIGNPEYVIHDIAPSDDFTLTPPPNYSQPWHWIDSKWTAEPTP